jgi:ADP-ribose pyrophosphatase
MSFFFFGTLRDRDLLAAVIDRPLDGLTFTPGWIGGYAARRAKDETFPVLVEDADDHLPGVVVDGLTETDHARIRFFEDAFYSAETVTVETHAGPRESRMFLVTDPSQATDEPWSLETWADRDRRVLRHMAVEFLAFFGRATYDEADEHWEAIRIRAERAVDTADASDETAAPRYAAAGSR